MADESSKSDSVHDWPLWHFANLEAAIERGDFVTAAYEQQELERLGVIVRYRFRGPRSVASTDLKEEE